MRLMDKVNQIVQMKDGTLKTPKVIKFVHKQKGGRTTGRMLSNGRMVPVELIKDGVWRAA